MLACGRDVNVLVLDTQVYSNTGGQASKATPRGAVAKFAAAGKPIGRKDLGLFAAGYGNVYVAQIALGADNAQTVKALAEAESWPGPSLIIAYSTCIAHGIDMSTSMSHQAEAVKSGFWPLWRYDPRLAVEGQRPMQLDSREPTLPLKEFQTKEARFAMLARSSPERYAELQRLAQSRRRGAPAALRAAGRRRAPRTGPRGGSGRRTSARRDGRGRDMSVDLRTTYLGLELANPLVPSASTLSARIDNLKRLQDAGASAIVMQSLFEEQIEHEEVQTHRVLETGAESFPEALSYMPDMEEYNTGPDEYLRHLEACKRELAIPVIGSLNGASEGGWIRYAKLIQDAGADALELNVYFIAADPDVSGTEVEQRYLELVLAVRESVTIPLAVKVGPYFSSMANMAGRFVEAGANGLVLFNRFLQPDIDLETLRVDPTLHLSTSDEMRLPLRWIAMLYGRVSCSLAATTGVWTAEDAVKLLLAGADVTMMASALFRHGPEHLGVVLEGMRTWLDEHEYASVEQLKGSVSQANVADHLGVRALELHADARQLHEPLRLARDPGFRPDLTVPAEGSARPRRSLFAPGSSRHSSRAPRGQRPPPTPPDLVDSRCRPKGLAGGDFGDTPLSVHTAASEGQLPRRTPDPPPAARRSARRSEVRTRRRARSSRAGRGRERVRPSAGERRPSDPARVRSERPGDPGARRGLHRRGPR